MMSNSVEAIFKLYSFKTFLPVAHIQTENFILQNATDIVPWSVDNNILCFWWISIYQSKNDI